MCYTREASVDYLLEYDISRSFNTIESRKSELEEERAVVNNQWRRQLDYDKEYVIP